MDGALRKRVGDGNASRLPKIALIIGAGFSCEAGLPSTKKVTESFLQSPQNGDLPPDVEAEISNQLLKFWQYVFHFRAGGVPPSLEDHFTILDLAANTGRNIGPEYPPGKLRAIRRLSIHRVFQILDRHFHYSPAIQQLFNRLRGTTEFTVVSTNWDIVVENHLRQLGVPYSYGLPVENLKETEDILGNLELLMLHGSANWVYCDSCRRLYAELEHGKAALRNLIYIETEDFRRLCSGNLAVIERVSNIPRQPKKCRHCGNRLGARIASFSYRKEVSIPQFQTVCQKGFNSLRDSETWLFIGYSLPEADFEFRHLLKSAEKAVNMRGPRNIRVILKDDCEAGLRFQRFFGIPATQIHQCGLSEWLRDSPDWIGMLPQA